MVWVILFHMVRTAFRSVDFGQIILDSATALNLCVIEKYVSKKCIKCNKISIWTRVIQRIRIGWKKNRNKAESFKPEPIWADPIKSFLFFSVKWKQNKPKNPTYRCVCLMNDGNTCVYVRMWWSEKQVTFTIKKTPQTHLRSLKTKFAPFLSIRFVKYHRKLESSIKLFLTASRENA